MGLEPGLPRQCPTLLKWDGKRAHSSVPPAHRGGSFRRIYWTAADNTSPPPLGEDEGITQEGIEVSLSLAFPVPFILVVCMWSPFSTSFTSPFFFLASLFSFPLFFLASSSLSSFQSSSPSLSDLHNHKISCVPYVTCIVAHQQNFSHTWTHGYTYSPKSSYSLMTPTWTWQGNSSAWT